ncbi:MAG: nuclear transport factor 2 family protein [Rhodothermales bacterium]|nr:nuclear transport factor 2 family protein [Rhodothermales bacterium]
MTLLLPILTVVLSSLLPASAPAEATEDLDAFWTEVSRTVAEGDFEGYAATYHPDAVLVNQSSGASYPIAQALDGWKQGFVDTAAGKMTASVEFRFTQRLNDETTAHETGMFWYSAATGDADATGAIVHFQALLVKMDGEWKMVMEYQMQPATEAEWEAAG